jgi:hypothetical protein
METIFILLGFGFFALLVITVILFFAFRNTKPTIINHGTIHNHYYGQDEQERPKSLVDENVRFLVRDLGELHREFRGIEKGEKTLNDRTLSE